MSTNLFGDWPTPDAHHGATVQPSPVDFEVYCPQCDAVIARDIFMAGALRAAAYHNTTFKTQGPKGPGSPPWANTAKPGFQWDTWMAKEISLKD